MGRRSASPLASGPKVLCALAECSTRFAILLYVPNGHAVVEVDDVIIDKCAGLPDSLRLLLRWDWGSDLAQRGKIASERGV